MARAARVIRRDSAIAAVLGGGAHRRGVTEARNVARLPELRKPIGVYGAASGRAD